MTLDIVGIILLLLFFIRGYSRGLILAVFSVVAILLGILVSLKLSASLSAWLLAKGYVSSGWVQVVSYVALFIVVVLVVRILARLLQKVVEGMMLGVVNQAIGGLLYALLGAILWSSLLWIGDRMHILTPAAIASSKTYAWFAPVAPWVFEKAGYFFPFVRDTFSSLQHFFDTLNQQLPGHVGAH